MFSWFSSNRNFALWNPYLPYNRRLQGEWIRHLCFLGEEPWSSSGEQTREEITNALPPFFPNSFIGENGKFFNDRSAKSISLDPSLLNTSPDPLAPLPIAG
jgi:hypothetical protein